MGSDESHFNFSVGSYGQSHRTVSTNPNLSEEKGEPKRYRTEVLPLTNLTPYCWAKPAHTEVLALYRLLCRTLLRFLTTTASPLSDRANAHVSRSRRSSSCIPTSKKEIDRPDRTLPPPLLTKGTINWFSLLADGAAKRCFFVPSWSSSFLFC